MLIPPKRLLVPSGRCRTAISMPNSLASLCNCNCSPRTGVSNYLQFAFPQPNMRAVAATTATGDRQALGVGLALADNVVPPAADRLHGERGGVMIHADTD